LSEGTLEARTFVSPTIKRQLILAMAPDRKNTRAAQSALQIITNEIENMVKEGIWKAEINFS
jgi:hypothetical protein